MSDFDPLDTFRSSVLAPDRARSDRIREEFRARIATMATDDQGRRPFDPPRPTGARAPRRQTALALVAVVALLAIAAGGAFGLREDGSRMPSIDELAATVATQPDQSLRAGQYLYRSTRTADDGGARMVESQWTALDGTGQRVVTALRIGRPGANPPSLTVYPEPGSLQFAGLSYDELRTLPTDPTALVARLRDLGAIHGPRTTDAARSLADLLALSVTPPDVAAAAVQALAQLGGAAIGQVDDAAGRTGLGVRGVDEDGAWLVVLEPTSGRALGFDPQWSNAADDGPSHAWIDQQITDGLPG